ncbi:extracellular solute-binding protein [Paenibacillus hemerocallicola]|jgi:multiple sugar transport system substrate-binding protein|uniref:Extracellular solute-binding protein n=1 Tax=Paenibacillus hemerocallicola TaxID=1172614 RepID=A0A5C4T5X5_9BACL|nr:extracellular solute-binding protein [Paenibacillus hemerocallicola]TNJ64448.1 extracellular solute-binding protein [Paenibacillus hemerocallicola]
MKPYKTIAQIALLAIAGTTLAGCGKSGESNSPANPADKEKAEQPIELVFYGGQSNWTDEMFWSLYGNAIKKKFPHITPKFLSNQNVKLKELITAGEQIDLMLVTSTGTPAYMFNYKLQNDISDVLNELKFDLNRFDSSLIALQRDIAKGGIYGLPVFTQFPLLFYNRSLFDKFGVSYPKDGMTWDEAYDLAVKMSRTDGGIMYYGLGTNVQWHLKTSQLPVTVVDPSTNKARSDGKIKQVFDNFSRFFMIPGYVGTAAMAKGTAQENMFFKDQNLAMWAHYSNVARRMPDTEMLNWDVASLPQYAEAKGVAAAYDPYYLYVTSTTKHKRQAVEVSAFLTSVENQIELAKEGFTTVIRDKAVQDAFGKNNKNYTGKNIKAFFPEKVAAASPYSSYYTQADAVLLNAFSDVVTGKKDVNTALREYEEEANKKIEDQIRSEK